MAKNVSTDTQKGNKAAGVKHIPILETRDFPGLYSYPKPQQIPRGAAQNALNFLTKRTWVEQRPGYHALGTEVAGSGKVLGIFTAHDWAGNEVIFKATSDGKLNFYSVAIPIWQEVGGAGANILAGAAAAGENVYMDEYFSPAGAQLWVSSPSSDLIKIMVANPASWLSQYNASYNFKGRIRILNNALFLWHYTVGLSSATKATLQRSYIDSQAYTTKTDSAVTLTTSGASVTGTLSKNSVANATVFATVFSYTDGAYSETFTDNYLGVLTGTHGGTGTINYSTGAFLITPGTGAPNPPSAPVVNCTYSVEDSIMGNGLANFVPDIVSNVRVPGSGVSWIQNDGGDILGINYYNGSYYIPHQRKCWIITPTSDDSGATNLIYRDNMYMPSELGSVATADGIYYVDVTNAARPFIGILSLNIDYGISQVLPTDLSSETLDLTQFVFDQCVAKQALDWILFFCRTADSPVNNRCIAYNFKLSSKKQRIFDVLTYFGSSGATFNGQLVIGDPQSLNAYKLFDGFDDDGGIINSFWIGNEDDHGIAGLKQTKKLWIEGYIGINQLVDVYVQLDANTAALVGTISGNGKYVDAGQSITVGSLQIGVYPIPGPSSEPVGFHYLIQITINSVKYKYFTLQFIPMAVGYFSFQMYANYDIRINVDKLPQKYRDVQSQIKGGYNPPAGIFTDTAAANTLVGAIDGVNTVYTLSHVPIDVYAFTINGEYIPSTAYTLKNNKVTMLTPLDPSLAGTPFEMVYLGANY